MLAQRVGGRGRSIGRIAHFKPQGPSSVNPAMSQYTMRSWNVLLQITRRSLMHLNQQISHCYLNVYSLLPFVLEFSGLALSHRIWTCFDNTQGMWPDALKSQTSRAQRATVCNIFPHPTSFSMIVWSFFKIKITEFQETHRTPDLLRNEKSTWHFLRAPQCQWGSVG